MSDTAVFRNLLLNFRNIRYQICSIKEYLFFF